MSSRWQAGANEPAERVKPLREPKPKTRGWWNKQNNEKTCCELSQPTLHLIGCPFLSVIAAKHFQHQHITAVCPETIQHFIRSKMWGFASLCSSFWSAGLLCLLLISSSPRVLLGAESVLQLQTNPLICKSEKSLKVSECLEDVRLVEMWWGEESVRIFAHVILRCLTFLSMPTSHLISLWTVIINCRFLCKSWNFIACCWTEHTTMSWR